MLRNAIVYSAKFTRKQVRETVMVEIQLEEMKKQITEPVTE